MSRPTHFVLPALLTLSLGALLAVDPIAQDTRYHDFADQRRLLGVANLWNVISNLPFLFVGLAGLRFCTQQRQLAPRSWQAFFAGAALVSIGSSIYHLAPDNQTLVWDRLPMTLAFMGLLVALLTEFVDSRSERRFLLAALLLGTISVMYWAATDDLRFYGWVQGAPLLAIVVIFALNKSAYSHADWYLVGLILYLLAKAAEAGDEVIFAWSGEQLSGHSLKHLLAAGALGWILRMLKRRQTIQPEA